MGDDARMRDEPMSDPTPAVLIVDDQPRNLDALEVMLAPVGCTLVRAHSADEALLQLLRRDFAAIVLDIRMPGMGGIELATLIKKRKRSQHVPILFLTAHLHDEADILRGYGVGAVDYLTKPVNAEILRSKIGVFIELFRKTHALGALNDVLQGEIRERQTAQEALQRANEELERRVQERTAALTRALRGVRENEERLRMAMHVARIAAWEWQLDSGDMTWGADPEELFGFPRGAFGDDRRIFHVLHPDDKARMDEAVATAIASGMYDAEYRAVRADGSVVWLMDRGRIVTDAEGHPNRMVGITRDVTAEREAEGQREALLREARAARDEAERQGRLKDEFLATLSHELRTPMTAILGWLSILIGGKAVRDVPSALAIIDRNARLQCQLIEDLLDMNSLIAGKVQLDIRPVDVGAIVREAMQALRPTAAAKQVALNVSIGGESQPSAADPRRLEQILWNLIHNAIKFTPAGGRVEARVEQHSGEVIVTVSDTGRGIAPDFLPYVFDRFRRQDASTTADSRGLGLGLSIAKHLVDLHGGKIEAFSDGAGKGATFVLRLPRLDLSMST
jgi:PAS domain S-box-containing protein